MMVKLMVKAFDNGSGRDETVVLGSQKNKYIPGYEDQMENMLKRRRKR